jgi:hypothetical protein
VTGTKRQAPALTPAPRELVELAHRTAGTDPERLTGWLRGHLDAGVPWKTVLGIVHLWIQTGAAEFHQLDDALTSWKQQHPGWNTRTDQGAR